MRSTRLINCAVLLAVTMAGAAFSQSSDAPTAFEASDIHTSLPTRFQFMRGPYVHTGLYDVYDIRDANMLDLISTAYGVNGNIVVGGPSWLEMDRFDVLAKAPAKSSKEALQTMLLSMLQERFKLVSRKDTRPMPAYALTAKRPTLKKSDGQGDPGCKVIPPGPAPKDGPPPAQNFGIECHNMTMKAFVEELPGNLGASQYLNDNPVIDQTGLDGTWDFNFHYTFRFGPQTAGEIITVFDALEKQLGLKLEVSKTPLPVIVVDSVNQKPTDNLPGAKQALDLGESPTEFEVAEIKPTDPANHNINFRIQPSGQVNLSGVSLKLLIQQTFNVTDDMMSGAPKWLDDDRWDIVAKPPASALGLAPGSKQPQVDFEVVLVMLRSLLAERFKMVSHTDERPVSAYTLMASKPKMKKADSTSRTRFTEGTASLDAKDPRNSNPVLSRLVTCQNMSMSLFAEQLQRIAPGYIHSPVLNSTGLDGGWDFTLSFSTAGQLQGGGRGGNGQPADPNAASDPTGAVSLPDAMEKQIGLKLVLEKRPVKVLVIDHIEPKPTEN